MRDLIQTLVHQHQTQKQIAQQVGVTQSTVSRELAKHGQHHPKRAYDAQQAQQRAGRAKKRMPYKLKGPLLTTVLARLRDRLSPEQICGELERKTTKRVLHHETVYRYIYRHQAIDGKQPTGHEILTQYLRIRHRKRYKKRGQPTRRQLMAPATRSQPGQYRPAARHRGDQYRTGPLGRGRPRGLIRSLAKATMGCY